MTYPLGSFPRFGHQARWASERRNRAILNSIFTRQMMAEEHLTKEMALYDIFCEILQGMTANTEEGEQQLAEIGLRLESIRRRHEDRRRVYYGVLGEILLFFCDVLGTYPELKDKDREGMKLVLESLADRHLAGEQVLHPHVTRSQSEKG
jgi:hypothetical protein